MHFFRLIFLTFIGSLALNATAAIRLTATMPSLFDVVLQWQDSSPGYAGHIVEFSTGTNTDRKFIILAFCPSNQTMYTHPRLVPDTTFYYRVRPYYGLASDPVQVSLPATLSDAEYVTRYAAPEDYRWGIPRTVPGETGVKTTIRNISTAGDAAPSDLKAELATNTVSGIKLTWENHANDAEGNLIEMKTDRDSDYRVRAVAMPDINSFGWGFAPPVRKGFFRVRAYYYGEPSNLVSEKTGPESQIDYFPKKPDQNLK